MKTHDGVGETTLREKHDVEEEKCRHRSVIA